MAVCRSAGAYFCLSHFALQTVCFPCQWRKSLSVIAAITTANVKTIADTVAASTNAHMVVVEVSCDALGGAFIKRNCS